VSHELVELFGKIGGVECSHSHGQILRVR